MNQRGLKGILLLAIAITFLIYIPPLYANDLEKFNKKHGAKTAAFLTGSPFIGHQVDFLSGSSGKKRNFKGFAKHNKEFAVRSADVSITNQPVVNQLEIIFPGSKGKIKNIFGSTKHNEMLTQKTSVGENKFYQDFNILGEAWGGGGLGGQAAMSTISQTVPDWLKGRTHGKAGK